MIRIVTDSMSDYVAYAGRDEEVTLVTQPVRFGLEEFMDDGVSLTPEAFYARMREAAQLPQTSMVAMADWKRAFNRLLEDESVQILCITGSSRLSGGYNSALLAREGCRDASRVTVVDTLTASCGEIMMIEYALEMKRSGCTMEAIAAALAELKGRQRIVGLADDLKYLVMGGRLSPLVGKVGGALNIKPTLKLEGGVIEKAGIVRGAKKGYAWYVEQLKQFPPDKRHKVFVAGADCTETVGAIREMILAAGIDAEVVCTTVGCVIGAHVGPGLTLVCWAAA